MLGVVNRYWKHIVRSPDDYFNKWLFALQLIILEIQINSKSQMDPTRWLVTYDELPRDEEKFPGKSPEYYPDYIGDQPVELFYRTILSHQYLSLFKSNVSF